MTRPYPLSFIRKNHIAVRTDVAMLFCAALFSAALPKLTYGQAATDACGFTAGAKYTVGATCVPVAFNKPATFVNDMTPTGCGAGTFGDAFGWFAGTGNPVIITYTPPTGADAVMHVFTGTCAAPVQVACSDACCNGAAETVTIPTVLGTNYLIRIQRYNASTVMNGTLCVYTAPPPPANDNPCGFLPLTVNAYNNCVNTASTTINATATTGPPAPSCANYQGGDVWFRVTVPAGGAFNVTTTAGSLTDGGMAAYTNTGGCLGTFTQVACNDDTNGNMPALSLTGLAAGVIYIRFWEYGNDNPGTFSICATLPPPPPANDDPCAATALIVNPNYACGTQTSGTLVGATASTGVPTAPCFGTPNDDVWFKFTATGPVHKVSLNNVAGSTTDMYMAVYSGSCGALTNIACSDPNSLLLSGLTNGSTYWVRVYSYSSTSGASTTFNVCVGTPPPPPACGQIFYDNGGAAGNYADNSEEITTICPPAGSYVSLVFSSFNLELSDDLFLFDGNSTSAPLIGDFYGTTSPGTVVATDPTGCITAYFSSDYSVNYSGWVAQVDCTPFPAGDCVYALRMHDSNGNGWGSSAVRVRINLGPWTSYTVTTSDNTVLIGVNIGDLIEFDYVATGPNQGQNSYTVSKLGEFPYFYSATPPVAGTTFSQTVTCNPPPAQPQDCAGAITICSAQAINNSSTGSGQVLDLNSGNQGCLSLGERQGSWYYFSPQTAGTISFSINPTSSTDDYDFAVWGPYPNAQCPTGPPLRCSFDAPGPYVTGLNTTAADTTEGASGTGWVKNINGIANQVYVLYIDNFSTSGQAFQLDWQLGPGASLDCTTLPVELLELSATARNPVIDVDWATATEHNSDHFTVQRSLDNLSFDAIGQVAAAGDATQRNNYRFTDTRPAPGINYYRLLQVDRNGAGELSQVVAARMDAGANTPLLYPNPAGDVLNLQWPNATDGMRLLIHDAMGRTVWTGAPTAATAGTWQVPVDRLAAGCYAVTINMPNGTGVEAGMFMKR